MPPSLFRSRPFHALSTLCSYSSLLLTAPSPCRRPQPSLLFKSCLLLELDSPPHGLSLGRSPPQARTLGADVSIWLDEFNWGGDWSGARTWPSEDHGALRGLLWAAYVLSAISTTENAVARGRVGFDILASYSLFRQKGAGWSHWASCAKVSEWSDAPEAVEFDGVAQVVAHFNFVALGSGHAHVTPQQLSSAEVPATAGLGGSTPVPCVQAVRFDGNASHSTWVALNVCPESVPITPIAALDISVYDAHDHGGWVRADDISLLETPPWEGGPLGVLTRHYTDSDDTLMSLSALSLYFIMAPPFHGSRSS